MKPLGPTTYTGSNVTASKYRLVNRVQTSTTTAKSSSASIKEECKLDVSNRKEKEEGRRRDSAGLALIFS
jgi:hypothetical protein